MQRECKCRGMAATAWGPWRSGSTSHGTPRCRMHPAENAPGRAKPRRTWTVDWPKVTEADQCRDRRTSSEGNDTILAVAEFGAIRIKAVTRSPKRGNELDAHQTEPVDARNVFDVLVTRCAGHPDCPDASEVIEGIANTAPTQRYRRAIWVYLRACTADDVRRAWRAGEFRMSALMEAVEKRFEPEEINLLQAVHEWMTSTEGATE